MSWLALALGVGMAYFLAAHFSLVLLTKPDSVAVFWPAAGISSGALIALGPGSHWPVALAVAVASATAGLVGERSLAASLTFALSNTGEALLVAWLIRQRFGADFRLESLRSVLGLFAAAGIGPALFGTVATVGFILFYCPEAPVMPTWLNWFASDALGIIMVAPLLIGLASLRQDRVEKWELAEGILTLAALAIVSVVAFGSPAQYWYIGLPLGLLLPVLLAAHCRPVFAAGAVLILGSAVVWTVTFGFGEELPNLHDRAYAGRATLLAISACTLVLAALFAERRRNEAALQDSNERLQLALDSAELGVWSIDAKSGRFQSDGRDQRIHGHPPANPPTSLAQARTFIHPEDLPQLDGAFTGSRQKGGSCKVEYRLAPPRWGGAELGPERWVAVEGTVVRDGAGEPVRWLGVTRDITHRKRAEQALAERDAQLALAGKVALVGSFAYDLGTGMMQVSQGYAVIHDLPEGCVETSRDDWRTRVHPDDLARLDRHFASAVDERRHDHHCEYRLVRNGGEVRWIESRSLISYGRDGAAQRVIGTNIDVTERKQTQAALEESEARLADALAAGQVMAFEWNSVTGQSRRSQNATAILGPPSKLACQARNTFLQRIHADDRGIIKTQIRQLSREHPAYHVCFRYCGLDGRELWLEETARGEFGADGRLLRVKGLTRDITERKKAELAIAERNLQLTLAGKAALVGSFAYTMDVERMQVSDGYAAIHGYPDGTTEVTRAQWKRGVHPEDLVRLDQLRNRAFRGRLAEYDVDYRVIRPSGELRWIDARCFVSYHSDGRPHRIVGVNIDITERKRAERQQRAMNAELDHRVKNVLATINAIIVQTQETSDSHTDFVAALEGRIRSLARTHELLSQSNWRGVDLAALARREFAPYAARHAEISGPRVVLKAESTQAVAIVLHELTTNAVKHGAFSSRGGRVSLNWCWTQNGSPASRRLTIDWEEIGGPTVVMPCRSGYGTSIVRELIPFELGGLVNLTFAPAGLHCRLEIPADWIQGVGSSDSDGAQALAPSGTADHRPSGVAQSPPTPARGHPNQQSRTGSRSGNCRNGA
jgi:PAS domain S-box-containing protein